MVMYRIRVSRRATKDLASLPKNYIRLIADHIEALQAEPRPQGAKKLKDRADYSLRVGPYRILYDIDDDKRIITIYRIKHRREAYR